MLVPEVTGADDPVIAILNLEHREAGETHRRARVVEQIVPFRLDAGDRREAKPVVVQQRALERRQPLGNAGTLAREIFANDLDHPSTRSWYSSERRLVISCRSPNASNAIGISTTAAKASSRRVRRLILISDRSRLR